MIRDLTSDELRRLNTWTVDTLVECGCLVAAAVHEAYPPQNHSDRGPLRMALAYELARHPDPRVQAIGEAAKYLWSGSTSDRTARYRLVALVAGWPPPAADSQGA